MNAFRVTHYALTAITLGALLAGVWRSAERDKGADRRRSAGASARFAR